MKRRFFALALVLVMAFTLCACRQTENIEKSVREVEEKLTSVEDCHLLLRITVGSPLELYLDENRTVLKTAGGDEDGESFLAGLELTGLSYGDAVAAILSHAQEQKLLTQNTDVKIDVLASAAGPLTREQTRQLEQAVYDYDELLEPFADQRTVIAAECGAEEVTVEELDNGDLFYDYYVNGVSVRQECYGADGSYAEWIYDETGRITLCVTYVEPNGDRSEERMEYENGIQIARSLTRREGDYTTTETERFEGDLVIYTGKMDSTGYSAETWFYPDGSIKATVNTRQEGDYTVTETERFEGDQLIYRSKTDSTGYFAETHFYPDGSVKSTEENMPQGENMIYLYVSCEEDGSSYGVEKFRDGTIRESSMNAHGRTIMQSVQYPDGSGERTEYTDQGIMIFRRYTYANGDWTEHTYDEYGRIRTEEGSLNGEYYIVHYDENGSIVEN